MNPPEPNDPLDAWLHEQHRYIEDGGFTARVGAALPRRRRAWLRSAFLLGVTAVGAALALRWLPWRDLPSLDLSVLLSSHPQPMIPWVLVFSVGASLIWSAVKALEGQD